MRQRQQHLGLRVCKFTPSFPLFIIPVCHVHSLSVFQSEPRTLSACIYCTCFIWFILVFCVCTKTTTKQNNEFDWTYILQSCTWFSPESFLYLWDFYCDWNINVKEFSSSAWMPFFFFSNHSKFQTFSFVSLRWHVSFPQSMCSTVIVFHLTFTYDVHKNKYLPS